MADEKNTGTPSSLSPAELLKQGQIFFLFCAFIYGAWVGIPKAWIEIKGFLLENQHAMESLADRQEKKLEETSTIFAKTIDGLVTEMKVGNDALKRFAEAEEAENLRVEAERRASHNATPQ